MIASAIERRGPRVEERSGLAPGNDAPIGGLKVAAASGWFAARPSGTEDVQAHLDAIVREAQGVVDSAMDRRRAV